MGRVKCRSLQFIVLGFCLFTPGVCLAEEVWPITFSELTALTSAAPADKVKEPGTSQPDGFDPARYKNAKDIPADSNIQGVTNVWQNALPYSLTEYYFDTDDEPSYVLELKEGKKRHALYTQVNQYKFSPDHKILALDNQVKQAGGTWATMNRIIDVASKRTANLPGRDCARFFEAVTNLHVVTYGSGTKKDANSFGPPRTVCIWNFQGKLQKALSVPVQNTSANTEESSNSFGLLPSEETTFFQLAYSDKHCVLRLQDLAQPSGHRQILMPPGVVDKDNEQAIASGDVGDPCEDGVAVEIDLSNLKLKGGDMRFRLSKSGRADLQKDWTNWKNYK